MDLDKPGIVRACPIAECVDRGTRLNQPRWMRHCEHLGNIIVDFAFHRVGTIRACPLP